jgi:hypothetical protein
LRAFFDNTLSKIADLIDMLTLLILFALNVATPGEMACVGSIQKSTVPMDLYIAGVEQEGTVTLAEQGQVVYLNGPRVPHLKAGMIQKVIRPEGKVHDPSTGTRLGIYYLDIGTVQIEAVYQGSAAARVLLSCQGMLKGDLVIPDTPKPGVEFSGTLSNDLTSLPKDGLVSTILLGKSGTRELGAGDFCFIGLGGHDGVKVGDRFTVFRSYPAFNPQDMTSSGEGTNAAYSRMGGLEYRDKMEGLLHKRILPPQILGDIIVVEVGDGVSAGKIINSLLEIHPGDSIVKR